LQPEPHRTIPRHKAAGYDYDECSAEVVLTRMKVIDGRLTLPDGMSYRALVLPEVSTMTPALLRKIGDLARAGATIVGPRPSRSPSLSDYPRCDEEINRLATELWANCDGNAVKEHSVGKGRIVCGVPPEKVLAQADVQADFTARPRLTYIHRADANTDIYFVANPKQSEVDDLTFASRVYALNSGAETGGSRCQRLGRNGRRHNLAARWSLGLGVRRLPSGRDPVDRMVAASETVSPFCPIRRLGGISTCVRRLRSDERPRPHPRCASTFNKSWTAGKTFQSRAWSRQEIRSQRGEERPDKYSVGDATYHRQGPQPGYNPLPIARLKSSFTKLLRRASDASALAMFATNPAPLIAGEFSFPWRECRGDDPLSLW